MVAVIAFSTEVKKVVEVALDAVNEVAVVVAKVEVPVAVKSEVVRLVKNPVVALRRRAKKLDEVALSITPLAE